MSEQDISLPRGEKCVWGAGRGEVSGFLSMTVRGGYREVKPSETLLVDMIGHGLLMPAVLQLSEVFCKHYNKKEY